ncbi:hypothetical protein Nepgr_033602 [Nepenthes gracilis]|uniref:Uncharacterized protein n=1 Tax=Nepenthes gracilis TaxID=150966 RepID=A0AAD3TKX3_NEPGR|nr:hypothetical protein Nepgr_033602 [Nepenthes gracilis]
MAFPVGCYGRYGFPEWIGRYGGLDFALALQSGWTIGRQIWRAWFSLNGSGGSHVAGFLYCWGANNQLVVALLLKCGMWLLPLGFPDWT